MTFQPTPTVIHPDRPLPTPVSRDAPVDDFVAMMEASGASTDFLSSLRRDGSAPELVTTDGPGRIPATGPFHDAVDQAMSNRSRFMTLTHAATKSRTNFFPASSLA